MPWVEGILSPDGSPYLVCYCSCFNVDGRKKVMAPKWDTLCKHEVHKRIGKDLPMKGVKKGEVYVVKTCCY
jgi:hypothetical protein